MNLTVLQDGSEKIQYNTPSLPLYVRRGDLYGLSNKAALCHWHDDVELLLCTEGYLDYNVNGKQIHVCEGNAIFVNSRQMHYGYSTDGSDCHYCCYTFRPQELFCMGDIADKFVLPLLTSCQLSYLILDSKDLQHHELLNILKQIDKLSTTTESLLHKMMRNKEIIQLLSLEKSLVYFSTSLKSNEVTLEKIMRGRIIKLYEEDEDLLGDVIIEIKQAIEMCSIYSNTLSGTMDAVSSIISNNLNNVMKILTSLTIIMTIPNIIFGMYGMNVTGLPAPTFLTAIVMAAVSMVIVAIILIRKGLF